MRLFLTLLVVVLPIAIAETETFKAEVVSGKTKLKCSFSMVFKGTKVDTKKSKAKCSRAKSTTKVAKAKVTSETGTIFTISMTVAKTGTAKFTKVSMMPGSPSGQGSGGPGGPPGKGSGGPGGPSGQGSGGSGGPPSKGSGGPGGPSGQGSGGPGGPPGEGPVGPEGPSGQGSSGPGGPPGKGSGGPVVPSGQGSGGPGGLPGQESGNSGMMKCRCKCLCSNGSEDCECDCDCPTGQTTSRPCGRGLSRVCPSQDNGACPASMVSLCAGSAEIGGGSGQGPIGVGQGSGGPGGPPGKGSGGPGGPSGQGSGGPGGPPSKGSGGPGGLSGQGSGGLGGPPGKGSGGPGGSGPPSQGRQMGPGNVIGTEVAGEGCTCIPNILLQMTQMNIQGQGQMGGPPGQGSGGPGKGSGGPGEPSGQGSGGPGGPPSGRAGSSPDQFDSVVKNGKTTLKCSFKLIFKGENVDTKKSTAKCKGAKKTEKVKNARVQSESGAEYSISMTVAKNGKVSLTIVLVIKAAENQVPLQGSGGPGQPGQGSGGSGPPGKGSGGPGGPSGHGSGGPGGPPGGPSGNGQEGPFSQSFMYECACVDEFVLSGTNGPSGNGPPGHGSGGPGQGSGGHGQGSGGPGQGSGGHGQGSGGQGQGSGGPGQSSGGSGQGSGEPGSSGSGTGNIGAVSTGSEFHSPSEEYHSTMTLAATNLATESETCMNGSPGCTGNCQNDPSNSYYSEMVTSATRTVLANGIPNHNYEHDASNPNPNQACEQRVVMSLPLNPNKGSYEESNMGPVGLSVTGGFIFNHLSSPTGDLAVPNEGPSLDSCFGHSEPTCRYHYHDINLAQSCTKGIAANVTLPGASCTLVGWMLDGFPLFACKNTDGSSALSSCYTGSGSNTAGYTFSASGSCQLDQANGYDFPEGYGYVVTDTYPWVPTGYMGSSRATICYLDGSAGGQGGGPPGGGPPGGGPPGGSGGGPPPKGSGSGPPPKGSGGGPPPKGSGGGPPPKGSGGGPPPKGSGGGPPPKGRIQLFVDGN